MKSIQDSNSHYNASSIRKKMRQLYGQVFTVNDYNFSNNFGTKILFDWQLEAINKIALQRFGITIAPCGSGKTLVVQTIAAIDAVRDCNRKQVILVSESAHAQNFIESCDIKFKLGGKKMKISWANPENFTEEFIGSKTQEAKSWLLSGNPEPIKKNFVKGSVCVMTHALFNRIFHACSKIEKEKICKNITILVDESHHLKGVSPQEDADMTKLSKAVNFIMDNAIRFNSRIFLCTATFFRGDYAVILSEENLKKFEIYQLPYVRHFLSLGIENYDVIHDSYEEDPIEKICENLTKCIRKGMKKHYIVVPPLARWNGNWRLLDPYCKRLKNAIIAVLVHELNYTKEQAAKRILDLVDPALQKLNKTKLSSEPKYGQDINLSQYDVVITCRMGREGTDWPVCCVVHNASPEKSPTIAVQTAGRINRKYPDKTNVICFYYLKNFILIDDPKCKTKSDLIADRVHYLILMMLMDEHLRPILLPSIKNKPENKAVRTNKKNKQGELVSLRDVFGDQWDKVKKNIIEDLSLMPVTEQNVDSVINDILNKFSYNKIASDIDIKDGLKVFILKSKSPELRNDFIDISFIRKNNFNKIVGKENESLFYRIEKQDWKTFQILKEDALSNDHMNLLCKHVPLIKAKELKKPVDNLTSIERHESLRDFYDFRDAYIKFEGQKRKKTVRNLAKSLSISEETLKTRIFEYNKIFEKIGRSPIIMRF